MMSVYVISERPGYLTKIDVKLDSNLCCKILSDEFLKTFVYFYLDLTKAVLQQNNDTKQTTTKVKTWLSDHNIIISSWPFQSYNLISIEYVWILLKRKHMNMIMHYI